jgi:hypothetical protein
MSYVFVAHMYFISVQDGWIVKVKNDAQKLSQTIHNIAAATSDVSLTFSFLFLSIMRFTGPPQDSMVLTIRSMMLFYGAMGIVGNPSSTRVLKKQLQSEKVGQKAER